MDEIPIGRVKHVWPKAHAASIDLKDGLKVGDQVRIRGHGHDFVQKITSIQVQRIRRFDVSRGEDAAIQIDGPVHEGDEILRLQDARSLSRSRWEEPPERW